MSNSNPTIDALPTRPNARLPSAAELRETDLSCVWSIGKSDNATRIRGYLGNPGHRPIFFVLDGGKRRKVRALQRVKKEIYVWFCCDYGEYLALKAVRLANVTLIETETGKARRNDDWERKMQWAAAQANASPYQGLLNFLPEHGGM